MRSLFSENVFVLQRVYLLSNKSNPGWRKYYYEISHVYFIDRGGKSTTNDKGNIFNNRGGRVSRASNEYYLLHYTLNGFEYFVMIICRQTFGMNTLNHR